MKHLGWFVGAALWMAASGSAFAGTRTITVTGTVDDPSASVTVNGVTATISGGTFSAGLTLSEGANTITATSTDAAGNTASASVMVTLDTAPPVLAISSPTDGQLFGAQ